MVILDAHNMPQLQINACSSYNDLKTTDSGGEDFAPPPPSNPTVINTEDH